MHLKNYTEIFSRNHCSLLVLLALALTPVAQAKPKVKILATGGTIAGARASTSEVGYRSGSFSIEQLIKVVPKMNDLAELSGEQPAVFHGVLITNPQTD